MTPEISKRWRSLNESEQKQWKEKAEQIKKAQEQATSSPPPDKFKPEKVSTPSLSLQKFFEDTNLSDSKKKDKKSKSKL